MAIFPSGMSEAHAQRLLRWANCTCFVLHDKFFFRPNYALDKPGQKMVNKSGQAGEISKSEDLEIELTPEMIEAGLAELWLYDPLVDDPRKTVESIVKAVLAIQPQ